MCFYLNHHYFPLGCNLEACLRAKTTSPVVEAAPYLDPQTPLLLIWNNSIWLDAFILICKLSLAVISKWCHKSSCHFASGVQTIHRGLSCCKMPPAKLYLTAHSLKCIQAYLMLFMFNMLQRFIPRKGFIVKIHLPTWKINCMFAHSSLELSECA